MISILGAEGFVGAAVAARARELNLPFRAYGRMDPLPVELGKVIYCIGLTADFRTRPLDTVEAHVGYLVELARKHRCDRLLYLSSTRVYGVRPGLATEEDALSTHPLDPSDLYNLSKAMGESVTASLEGRGVIARLSNVYGPRMPPSNFLSNVLRQARQGCVELQTATASSKDYISIYDVADLLLRIVQGGADRLYNVASGQNISHLEILDRIRSQMGCAVQVAPDAPIVQFPRISIHRIESEFSFSPRLLLSDLAGLLQSSV